MSAKPFDLQRAEESHTYACQALHACMDDRRRLIESLREVLIHIKPDGETGVQVADCYQGNGRLQAARVLLAELEGKS